MKKKHDIRSENNIEDTRADSNKPILEDAKVIKGSVDDLMSNQDKKTTFAEYLMEVLNTEANHDVLQWMPCGTQFTITNHRKFTMDRMPELFKIRNMSSFVRKLTRWGFARVHEKESGNSDIFKHPNFQREKPELCKKIRCVNRATASNSAHLHYGSQMDSVMGNLSESLVSSRHVSEMHMMTPQRRMAPNSYPPHHTRSPYGGPRSYTPRVSPEYEKEMMPGSAFRPSTSVLANVVSWHDCCCRVRARTDPSPAPTSTCRGGLSPPAPPKLASRHRAASRHPHWFGIRAQHGIWLQSKRLLK